MFWWTELIPHFNVDWRGINAIEKTETVMHYLFFLLITSLAAPALIDKASVSIIASALLI